jgi:dTDP-glucose pyrophosphorylase
MKDFLSHCIKASDPILDAIKKINELSGSLTLLIIDENGRMVGTLTDGDIRRGFIKGYNLDDKISCFMSGSFHSIQNDFSVAEFKKIRNLGIKLLPQLDKNNCITRVYDLRARKSLLPLECMIMAGGRGERLRPLTDSVPKPMLLLGGKPIIEHNIDRLISFGIEKIYISVKYLGQQIVDYFGDGSSKGISIEYIWEDQPLGTAGALSMVKRFDTEYVLLMNSDLFTDVDFEDLYLNLVDKKAQMGVATIPYTTKVPFGIFAIDEDQITGIREKPTYTNYANAGIYILNCKLIDKIPKNQFYNITDLIDLLILEKQRIIHNPIIGYWIDIGQLQDYINAQEIVKHLKNGN